MILVNAQLHTLLQALEHVRRLYGTTGPVLSSEAAPLGSSDASSRRQGNAT